MGRFDLIAWDFDGVLNRNVIDGALIWARDFETDLGAPLADFQNYVFRSGRFRDVLIGKRDLRTVVANWIATAKLDHSPEDILDYWFAKDAHTDVEILALLKSIQCRHVIATNNEAHRARFILQDMGFSSVVEHMFAAGPMGTAKPSPEFFKQIEEWSGLPADRLVLIDDADANIKAAAKRGWQTFLFSDETRAGLAAWLGR